MLQLSVPIEVQGSSRGQDVLELECIASGNPVPTIQWSFEGKIFVAGKNLDGTDGGENVQHTLKGIILFQRHTSVTLKPVYMSNSSVRVFSFVL